MKSQNINALIRTHSQDVIEGRMSRGELAKKVGLDKEAVRKRWNRLGLPPIRQTVQNRKMSTEAELARDLQLRHLSGDKKRTDKKYHLLQAQLDDKDRLLRAVVEMKGRVELKPIVAKYSDSVGEATAVVLASDWHVEEKVVPEKVNFKNEYTLPIAKIRAEEFFTNTLKLINLHRNVIKIDTLVLALLGDFITGNIHEELLANCSLPPVKAMIYAQNLLISGVQYLLDNSDLKLVIPCHVGNHPRITKKVYLTEEQGNSLEYYMYYVMANHFRNEKRIEWQISESHFSFVDVYRWKLCFHHGHFVKYSGGVGGLTVPMLRSIGQWDLKADIYCNGHYHTRFDGDFFLSNGSNIGYGCSSIAFKGREAPPSQWFFLVDKKRGKTVTTPILYSV